MKIILYIAWLCILIIGATCYTLVPEVWQYIEAFSTGSISVVLLISARELG